MVRTINQARDRALLVAISAAGMVTTLVFAIRQGDPIRKLSKDLLRTTEQLARARDRLEAVKNIPQRGDTERESAYSSVEASIRALNFHQIAIVEQLRRRGVNLSPEGIHAYLDRYFKRGTYSAHDHALFVDNQLRSQAAHS